LEKTSLFVMYRLHLALLQMQASLSDTLAYQMLGEPEPNFKHAPYPLLRLVQGAGRRALRYGSSRMLSAKMLPSWHRPHVMGQPQPQDPPAPCGPMLQHQEMWRKGASPSAAWLRSSLLPLCRCACRWVATLMALSFSRSCIAFCVQLWALYFSVPDECTLCELPTH